MSAKYHLGVADYAIVLASLVISSLIGIGFRFAGDRQKTTIEYLLAGKNSRMLPVVMSTSVTTISGIAILGMPAEVYKYGAQITVHVISLGVGMIFAAYLFIPVYFACEVSSIYEYLEMRFGKYTRYTISAMFMMQMFLYMSVVLFAPVLALSAVTDMSMELAIILCGSVCTFYCFLGGLKAVLWADVFQSILMFACVSIIVVVGIYEIGDIGEIFKRANTTNRLNFFDLGLDLTTRYSFWNCFLSGLLMGIGFYGSNQIQVQRVLSMSEIKRARTAILWSIIPVWGLYIVVCLIGIVIYSIFYLCDPVLMRTETGISTYDQLVPYFIITRLGSIPGLTGLCISGIFSGSLSTMSSALNSMSTVAVIDFVKPNFKTISDTTLVFIAKGLSLLFGIICILLTFAIASVESITQAAGVFLSVVEGPVIGTFLIGFFTRKVSDKSAVLGLLISLIVLCWIGFGSMITGYTSPTFPLETSGCPATFNSTAAIFNSTATSLQDRNSDVFVFYKMAFGWYPVLGCIITVCTSFLISFVIDRNKSVIPSDSKCLTPITHYWMRPEYRAVDKQQDRNAQIEDNSL